MYYQIFLSFIIFGTIAAFPNALDYRSLGKVTPAKDQKYQQCGSCYAFAAVGAIESQYLIRYNKTLDLSEQYLVSCTTGYSQKCKYGSAGDALIMVIKSGIPTETCDPYIAANGTCSNECQEKYWIKSIALLSTNESDFAAILNEAGPFIFSLFLPSEFYTYTGGILDVSNTKCNEISNAGTHVMLLVGYTKDYWIAKNSFGPAWGENGFIRFKKGVNFCGMTRSSISVTV